MKARYMQVILRTEDAGMDAVLARVDALLSWVEGQRGISVSGIRAVTPRLGFAVGGGRVLCRVCYEDPVCPLPPEVALAGEATPGRCQWCGVPVRGSGC